MALSTANAGGLRHKNFSVFLINRLVQQWLLDNMRQEVTIEDFSPGSHHLSTMERWEMHKNNFKESAEENQYLLHQVL